MNILLVNYEYPPIGAGAANSCRYLARELHRLGHAVSVLTAAFDTQRGRRDENGITVFRIAALRKHSDQSNILEMASFALSACATVGSIVRSEHIDRLIVFFSIPCGPVGLLGKLLYQVPYIVALRGGDVPGSEPSLSAIHKILTPLRRVILKSALAVTVNSAGLGALSSKSDSVPIIVIPNGVDTDFFSPAARSDEDSGSLFKFLFVGRLQEQKNVRFMLESFFAAARQSSRPLELHMVGNGPQAAALQQWAAGFALAQQIVWHGWLDIEAVREQYRTCHALLNLALGEGMPNAVLEAMACEMVVIASDVAGNNDLIQHEKTGLLLSLGSVAEAAAVLCRAATNPAQNLALRSAARAAVSLRYSWPAAAQRYADLLTGPGVKGTAT